MLIYSCNTFYLTLSGTLLHTQNVVVIKTAKVSKNLHFSEVAEQVTIEPKKKNEIIANDDKWYQTKKIIGKVRKNIYEEVKLKSI